MHYWDHLGAEWAPLPCQSDHANRHKRGVVPEKKLIIAMVQRALQDLVGEDACGAGPGTQREALVWFESKDTGPGTWLWACKHLRLKRQVYLHEVDIRRAILLLGRAEKRITLTGSRKIHRDYNIPTAVGE